MKKGWENKKLNEICDVVTGKWDANHAEENGLYRFYTCARDYIFCNTKHFSGECLILPGNGVNVGDVYYYEGEFDAYQRTYVLSNLKASTRYVYYHMLLYWKERNLNKQFGSATNFIKMGNFSDYEISLPPLPEQQRIVSVLDEAFASIAGAKSNAERNLVNARELFESHLKGVFETKSDDWEEKILGDIGKVSMCKRVYKEQTTTTGDIPFYKIGTFGKEPDVFIPKSLYDEFRNKFSFPKKGDILISAAGTIGRRVKYDGEPAYFQDSNIVWIDNDEKQVLNDYLYQFYGACDWNSTTGATIPRLYNDNLRQIEIHFPKSLAEQRAIVKRLEALSAETGRLEEIYQQKVEALEELKKSVLGKAFAGEL